MYGIIGNPLAHSWSPKYFSKKFQESGIRETYEEFPLASIEEFPDLLKQHPDLRGLNVTIPFKEKIITFLDKLSPEADAVQSVNCIAIKNGETFGYNTDLVGFEKSLTNFIPQNFNSEALILGTGGSSKSVSEVLENKQIPFQFVSRKEKIGCFSYTKISASVIHSHLLIINTTPLGMWPETDKCPDLPYEEISEKHFLFDLIYNPEETLFLKQGKERATKVRNGLEMLQIQAEASWEIWNRK